MPCNMKDLKDFLNESMGSSNADRFYDIIAELFDYFLDNELWNNVYKHFKRNKSIFKAIDYYDAWRDLLGNGDEFDKIYGTRAGRNKVETDLQKFDAEVSKKLLDHINGVAESSNRDTFIAKVRIALNNAIVNKSIDAWFFNWAESDKAERASAEKYISSILPGKWKFMRITGNGTNVGEGWFKNKENDVTISLSCDNEGETDNDYIDGYTIE